MFPINLEKNKVLLSNLVFTVNGEPKKVDLESGSDKLVWTGRLVAGAEVAFRVAFHGRGLDSLTYTLDPAAPVRNLHLAMHIRGGANFDYPDGVVPANSARAQSDEVWLDWRYDSLQSGIPVGVILPSEKSLRSADRHDGPPRLGAVPAVLRRAVRAVQLLSPAAAHLRATSSQEATACSSCSSPTSQRF